MNLVDDLCRILAQDKGKHFMGVVGMNGHLTAISRRSISAPARRLEELGLIEGRTLDYGCGKGMDADTLDCERYDPYYSPDMPTGLFDTILCAYVLNVIPDRKERENVLRDIESRLVNTGSAYITVRTDRAMLKGVTSRNTWQGLIELDLPVVAKGSGFKTYMLKKGDLD